MAQQGGDPTVMAVSGAVTALATAGGNIFGKKQEAKLEQEKQRTARTEGILQIKQNQQAQALEREKQRAKTQRILLIVGVLMFLAVIAGILYYKHSQK
jgi:hypothetical protein